MSVSDRRSAGRAAPAAASPEADIFSSMSGGIDQATRLLKDGRYGELAERAGDLERQASDLKELLPAWEQGRPTAAAASCQRLRRKTLVFSELLRHVLQVHSGLVEILKVSESYRRDGRSEGRSEGRQSSRVRVEA